VANCHRSWSKILRDAWGTPLVKNQVLHGANLTSFHQLSGVCNMYKKYAKQRGPQIQAAQEPATINYCLY